MARPLRQKFPGAIFHVFTKSYRKGDVFLDDEDITAYPMYLRARKGVGYLPQETSIFRKLTVEENILILWELMPEIKPANYEKKLVSILDELVK